MWEIELALEGQSEFWSSILGGNQEEEDTKVPATPENFRLLVAQHNARFQTKE